MRQQGKSGTLHEQTSLDTAGAWRVNQADTIMTANFHTGKAL